MHTPSPKLRVRPSDFHACMKSISAAVQEPLNPPAGESAAAFCFRDLAEISAARVTELHTQAWGEAMCCRSPAFLLCAVDAVRCTVLGQKRICTSVKALHFRLAVESKPNPVEAP